MDPSNCGRMFDKCSTKVAKSDAISDHPSRLVLTYDPLDGCFLTHSLSESRQWPMNPSTSPPREQTLEVIRKEYPPLLTSAHVAELMQCTIWEVRDQVHRGEPPAVRRGQQFRFFREEVLAVERTGWLGGTRLIDVSDENPEITYEKCIQTCHRLWTAKSSPICCRRRTK